jgi:RimJ/RimL family protein N-acetyltransferase
MNNEYFIEGKIIYLREVRENDVNEDYYRWMNDTEVTRYTEVRHSPQTMEDIRRYVKNMREKDDQVFLAICLKEENKHIGNIKIGPIHSIHHFADLSLIIGEKNCWGRGVATEAIRLAVDYGFNKLNLHRLSAGIYENNKGSIKAFQKAGFTEEGVLKESYLNNKKYLNVKLFGIVNNKE